MHCGWIDDGEWISYAGPALLGIPPHSVDLTKDDNGEPRERVYCPGYLSRLPMVREAWHAFAARRDGILPLAYPRTELSILDATDIAVAAIATFENFRIKDLELKSKR